MGRCLNSECLFCEHRDLSLLPSSHARKPSMAACTCNPRAGKRTVLGLDAQPVLSNQWPPGSVRDLASKNKMERQLKNDNINLWSSQACLHVHAHTQRHTSFSRWNTSTNKCQVYNPERCNYQVAKAKCLAACSRRLATIMPRCPATHLEALLTRRIWWHSKNAVELHSYKYFQFSLYHLYTNKHSGPALITAMGTVHFCFSNLFIRTGIIA